VSKINEELNIMFLAMREIMHSKVKFAMIVIIFVMMAWLVFILSGLGNGLSSLAASAFKNMRARVPVFHEQVPVIRSIGGRG